MLSSGAKIVVRKEHATEHQYVSGDDLRSVHELHHRNVLLLSVPCHDHALPRSRVLHHDLR